ncbi:unnamed protein product [Clavelina lepadiformis]|uniref:Uncharacterized protein n=1 Tax=Clavelina lepadiformis TaxID=159417 RepID=A0ABP0GCA5_CLALP
MLPGVWEWKIPLREGESAYLRFEETSIRCQYGLLEIETSETKALVCEPKKPGNYLSTTTVNVSMQRNTENCSLARIFFNYSQFGE